MWRVHHRDATFLRGGIGLTMWTDRYVEIHCITTNRGEKCIKISNYLVDLADSYTPSLTHGLDKSKITSMLEWGRFHYILVQLCM
jgi:hypothetical protein